MISCRRTTWPAAIGIVLCGLLLTGCDRARGVALEAGDRLPALTIESLNGPSLDSSRWLGRTVVLNIWATWCPPCREEMPALQRLSESLPKERYRVFAIALDEDRNLVREFALQYGITFPLGIDPDGVAIKATVGLHGVPDTLIIAPDGRIIERVLGSADWASDAMRRRVVGASTGSEATSGHVPKRLSHWESATPELTMTGT